MAGQLPPIPSPPAIPPQPAGLDAVLPKAAGEGPWYRRLLKPWSLPLRVAVFVAVVLVLIVVGCWWEFRTNPYHVPWRYSLTPLRAVAVLLLLMVIPVSIYQALKLWFQGEKSQFPDIEAAWQAGREALRKQGLDLGDKPLFLVLGSSAEDLERALFDATKATVLVRGVPEGPAALHWYVSSERIFLACTGASWLSALSALIAQRGKGQRRERGASPRGPVAEAEMQRISATIQPHAFMADEPAFGTGSGNLGKSATFDSINLDELRRQQTAATAELRSTPAPVVSRETLAPEAESLAIIQPSDAAEQEDRLESVCEMLRHARYPFSPINGCITLIPFAASEANQQEIDELAKAINSDLSTVHRTLRVRYPVTAIFTGMEEEPGFRELMRRVGPERCAVNRFGLGYDLRSPASSSEIGTFAAHVCGVFEDWVYGLFREDQVLKRPGNSFLFSLLCRIRSSFKDRLAELLSQGFGYNDRLKPEDAPFLFSGCYFVASGRTEDHRAFIQGISEKLEGEQDRLEWSRPALVAARRARRLAVFAFVMIAVLAVHLVLMVFLHPPGGR